MTFPHIFPQMTDAGLLAIRFGLAPVFLAHGLSKLAMWKMQPSEQLNKKMLGILRLLSICEPLGALAVLAGFLTQLAGLGLAIIMLGAIHLKITKMKKKFAPTPDVGWEFEFALLMMALALHFAGAGAISFDHAFLGM